jgi:hypothetical protein
METVVPYRDKHKGSKFKCWKTEIYRYCKKCFELHGEMCDYDTVMNFKPIERRNRCPICRYKKEKNKCEVCTERR